MSTIALRVIELVKSLPPEDQQTIADALSRGPNRPVLYGDVFDELRGQLGEVDLIES